MNQALYFAANLRKTFLLNLSLSVFLVQHHLSTSSRFSFRFLSPPSKHVISPFHQPLHVLVTLKTFYLFKFLILLDKIHHSYTSILSVSFSLRFSQGRLRNPCPTSASTEAKLQSLTSLILPSQQST